MGIRKFDKEVLGFTLNKGQQVKQLCMRVRLKRELIHAQNKYKSIDVVYH